MSDNGLIVPTTYLEYLERYLAKFGVTRTELYQGTNIPTDILSQESQGISLRDFQLLISRAESFSGQAEFGVEMGAGLKLTAHGDLGLVFMASCTLRDALSMLVKYVGIRTNLVSVRLVEGEGFVHLELEPAFCLGEERFAVEEIAITAIVAALRAIAPEKFSIHSLHFSRQQSNQWLRDREVLQLPISYGQSKTRLIMPAECLALELELFDRTLQESIESRCMETLKTIESSAALSLRIKRRLYESQLSNTHIKSFVEEFHMSERTLRRRLEEEGTSFQRLVNETREELAKDYLSSSSFSINEISCRLGYNDPSNFGNAFKRWTGCSPSRFRNRLSRQAS